MSKSIDQNLLERVAARNGFDPESLLQVMQRFQGMRPALRKQAILRAIETENWSQLEAFICLGSWVSLGAIKTLPPPLAAIPEVAQIWESEWLAWLLAGAGSGSDRLKKIPLERKTPEAKQKWLPLWRIAWTDWMKREIRKSRDTFHRLPEALREDLEIQSQRIKLWCEWCLSSRSPTLERMPKNVLKNPEGYAALRTRVLRIFDTMTEWMNLTIQQLAGLDPRLQQDQSVLQARRSACLRYLTFCDYLPYKPEADLLQDAEVYSAWLQAWIRHLKAGDPQHLAWRIPEELANHGSIMIARRAGFLKCLRENRLSVAEIKGLKADFLKADGLLRQEWEESFIKPHRGKLVKDSKQLFEEWLLGQNYFGRQASPATQLWSDLAEKVALDLNVAPPECQRNPECLHSWLEGWLAYLASCEMAVIRNPSSIPQELKDHERVQEALRQRWLRYVFESNTRALDRFEEIPAALAGHPSLAEIKNRLWNQAFLLDERDLVSLVKNATASPEVKHRLQNWGQIQEDCRRDPFFQKAWGSLFTISKYDRAALDHLLQFPACDRNLVSLWRHSTDTRKQDVPKALLALRKFPWALEDLSPGHLSHPLISESAEQGVLELIQKDARYEQLIPESLAQSDRIRSFFEMRNTETEAEMKPVTPEKVQPPEATKDKTSVKRELSRWEREIRKDGTKYAVMPIRLRGEPRLLGALRESVGPLVRKNPGIWTQLPAIIREDECLQRVFRIATRGPLAGLEVKNAA